MNQNNPDVTIWRAWDICYFIFLEVVCHGGDWKQKRKNKNTKLVMKKATFSLDNLYEHEPREIMQLTR
jgi:hypothetical protein